MVANVAARRIRAYDRRAAEITVTLKYAKPGGEAAQRAEREIGRYQALALSTRRELAAWLSGRTKEPWATAEVP